jgi:diadenosine tetraphosphate (Ap4A) HIT family hydrolase
MRKRTTTKPEPEPEPEPEPKPEPKPELKYQNHTQVPMPAIQKIRDIPLSSAQTDTATNNLDEQRFKEDEHFRSFLSMHTLAQVQAHDQRLHPQLYYQPPPQYQQPQIYYQQPHIYYQQPQIYYQQSHYQQFENNIESFQEEQLSFPWNEPPLPEYLDPKKSIDLKLIRKPNKKDTRCYTCKPRGKVKKHMINTSGSGKFVFHHDMHKRPVIIMTPSRHIETIYELTPEELSDLFKSLKEFAAFWNVDDYQLSFNMGNWQTHEHFHCKIRLSEKVIARMRRDHFQRIKLENRYNNI